MNRQEAERAHLHRLIDESFDKDLPTRAVLLAIEDGQLTMHNIGADNDTLVQMMELAYSHYRENMMPPHLRVETVQ